MNTREQNTTAFASLPWPHTADKTTLRIVASCSGNSARSASLARFLSISFLSLAVLLLLVGLSKRHEASLVGAGGLLLAGLSLLAVGRFNASPVLLLNREKKEVLLSRRRLGRLQFYSVPVDRIEMSVEQHAAFCRLHITPRRENGAGQEGGGSAQDKQWRSGMTLTCGANGEHVPDLLRNWLNYDAVLNTGEHGNDGEYTAALHGLRLPPQVEAWARPASAGQWREKNAETEKNPDRRAFHFGSASASEAAETLTRHPEIHRARDLRDATRGRDKRY